MPHLAGQYAQLNLVAPGLRKLLLEHLLNISVYWIQAKREEFADLALAIFVRDPPNDPKTLQETRKHGSVKGIGHSSPSKHKGSKQEVRGLASQTRFEVVNSRKQAPCCSS